MLFRALLISHFQEMSFTELVPQPAKNLESDTRLSLGTTKYVTLMTWVPWLSLVGLSCDCKLLYYVRVEGSKI